jgi:hypothetical protein
MDIDILNIQLRVYRYIYKSNTDPTQYLNSGTDQISVLLDGPNSNTNPNIHTYIQQHNMEYIYNNSVNDVALLPLCLSHYCIYTRTPLITEST